jgi:hypothetical protein
MRFLNWKLGFLFLWIPAFAFATDVKIERGAVPAAVLAAFDKSYPESSNTEYYQKLKEKENRMFYEIRTIDGGISKEITYRPDGSLYKTVEVLKDLSELPEPVQIAFKDKVGETRVNRVCKVDRVGTIEYVVSCKEENYIFDGNGHLKSQNSKSEK